MDDLVDFYKDCGRQGQSETFNDTNDEIVIIQLVKDASSLINYTAQKLSGQDKTAWLTSQNPSENQSVVLQLVQIGLEADSYSSHRHLDISRENYIAVIQKLGLRGLVEYGTSATQVFSQVTEDFQGYVCTYSTVHIDDYFTLFYKYNNGTRLTQALYWASPKISPLLERALYHQRALGDHPSFLNLCAVACFGAVLDSRLCIVSEEMARIERRTGFKAWDLGRYKPAQGDSYALSATASGYATSLAANKRLNRLAQSILQSCDEGAPSVSHGGENQLHKRVAARIKLLSQRNETQALLIDYLTARLQNQITALFSLITQTDTRISISLAKDSRMIASASKHDSSSMKALAAVTVAFLPGTFISSLFSTSMFNWQAEADSSVLNGRFWIYWAFTLPLTLVTILIWLAWTRVEDARNREQVTKEWPESMDGLDPPA